MSHGSQGEAAAVSTAAPNHGRDAAAKALPAGDLAEVLEATRTLWSDAAGGSFFLTGGTGFFGTWLLESFAHANDTLGLGMRAVVLTRDPDAFARRAPHLHGRHDLSFIAGDVRSFRFPEGRFEYVIHAATEASARLNEEDPEAMFDVIVAGTRRVLAFAAQARVAKLLLVSSGAVYGRQPADMPQVPESYSGGPNPLEPASAYAEGKRAAEHLGAVHARRHGYELKVARCFAFVGPHLPLDAHFAIGNFIRDALAGGPIRVAGDGSAERSYLYASDLAAWLWTILFRGPSSRAFNVGSPDGVSVGRLAAIVRDAVGVPTSVEIQARPDPARPVSRYVPATDQAAEVLGLRPTVGLVEAIRRTAAWHRG